MKKSRQSYMKDFIDLIGPSKLWPHQIRLKLFSSKHLNNRDRFACTIFLLCNGVNPRLIREFYHDCFNFDAEANRHINYLIDKYPTSNWKQWNVALNKSI
jgi:hypothetical protein